MAKKMRIEFRCDEKEYQVIVNKALMAGLTLSEFIRRVILGRVIKSVVDRKAVGELRRLGGMLKHLYPKALHWTLEEKRRYWAAHEQLVALAVAIEDILGY
jgi:hypothetical protein